MQLPAHLTIDVRPSAPFAGMQARLRRFPADMSLRPWTAELVSGARSEHPPAVVLRRLFVLFVFALTAILAGCKSRPAPGATEDTPLPTVTEASIDLLLTWIDDKGEFHVEQKVANVPASARDVVRVADPVKDPPKLDDVFVADLRTPGPGGAYPVRTMSRPDFEKIAVERRKQHGQVLTAQSATGLPADARPTVIIYGASWCGPCHQAAAYLKQRGIAFVEKDIEQDGTAAREMHAKLATAGMRGGSIPVIDVRGKLVVGFDQRTVDRLLSSPL
jgi:glutaredoxin